MQSIQVSFLCVFGIREYIKNGGINFGLSSQATLFTELNHGETAVDLQ